MQVFSFLSLLLSAIIYRGDAIECYNCGDCNSEKMVLADCSNVGGYNLGSISCMRTRTSSGVVSRSCGIKKLRELANINSGCVEANGATVCACETNSCNGGNDWSASSYNDDLYYDDDTYTPYSYSGSSSNNSIHFYYFTPLSLLLIIPCCIIGLKKNRPNQSTTRTIARVSDTRAEEGNRSATTSSYLPPAYSYGYDQPKSGAPTIEELPTYPQSSEAASASGAYLGW